MIPHLGSDLKNLVSFLLDFQAPGCAAPHGILNPSLGVIRWPFAGE